MVLPGPVLHLPDGQFEKGRISTMQTDGRLIPFGRSVPASPETPKVRGDFASPLNPIDKGRACPFEPSFCLIYHPPRLGASRHSWWLHVGP